MSYVFNVLLFYVLSRWVQVIFDDNFSSVRLIFDRKL